MATKKKGKSHSHHKKNNAAGYGRSKYKRNPATKMNTRRRRRNAAGDSHGLTGYITNAVFVIVGALGSKLGAQAVLGSNNTGVVGYVGNAAIGAAMWLLTEHVMKNRQASSGVIAGTIVQILLRAINDFTPFGSYVSGLGFGDYQMQSFTQPQVLVDPWNSAQVLIPNGWGAPPTPMALPTPVPSSAAALPAPAAAGAPSAAASGMSGMYGPTYSGYGWGGLYGA